MKESGLKTKMNSLKAKNIAIGMLAFGSFFCAGTAHALSLSTGFAGGNGQSGNMFDVVTLGGPLTVTGLDVHIDATTAETVEVYSKSGTYVGSETNSAAWTLIDTVSVTGAGAGLPTFVDITDFVLPSLMTTALYVTLTMSTNIDYTNGTGVGNVAAANSDLQILEGAGKAYPFGATFTPRVWNGTIYYDKASVPVPATLALMGLGLAGIGFRRRKQIKVA